MPIRSHERVGIFSALPHILLMRRAPARAITIALMAVNGPMSSASQEVKGRRAYSAGTAVALVTSFVSVWTTIVRDDGTGIGFFLVIMAAGVGAYAALFRPDGMMRTMVGVAIMQALFGVAMATAPSTAILPDGVFRAIMSNSCFTMLWLVSANFFRVAASRTQQDGQQAASSLAA